MLATLLQKQIQRLPVFAMNEQPVGHFVEIVEASKQSVHKVAVERLRVQHKRRVGL